LGLGKRAGRKIRKENVTACCPIRHCAGRTAAASLRLVQVNLTAKPALDRLFSAKLLTAFGLWIGVESDFGHPTSVSWSKASETFPWTT
jgi:hypothetical protein